MTVYFVDEDFGRYGPWIVECSFQRLDVCGIGDADQAYNQLTDATDVELVVVDVMLSAKYQSSRFSPERTDNYLKTGLCLAEDLASNGGPAFPNRIVLLTNAVGDDIFRAANDVRKMLDIPLWQKPQILSPFDFAERVRRRVDELTHVSTIG